MRTRYTGCITIGVVFFCVRIACAAAVVPPRMVVSPEPSDSTAEESPSQKKASSPPESHTTSQGPSSSPRMGQPRQAARSSPQAPVPAGTGSGDLIRIVQSLKESSMVWMRIASPELKEMAVYYFITEYKEKGITIRKSPRHYVELMDSMSAEGSEMATVPFADILRTMAVIEYDFDNGQDKDALARQVLGPEGARRNKIRLGIP